MITYFNMQLRSFWLLHWTQHEEMEGEKRESEWTLRGFICHLVVSHVGKEWRINQLDLLLNEREEVGLFAQLCMVALHSHLSLLIDYYLLFLLYSRHSAYFLFANGFAAVSSNYEQTQDNRGEGNSQTLLSFAVEIIAFPLILSTLRTWLTYLHNRYFHLTTFHPAGLLL